MDTTTRQTSADRSPTAGEASATEKKPGRRWLWFLGIWLASVLALTVVSQIIRWAIMP